MPKQYLVVNVPGDPPRLQCWQHLEFIAVDPKGIGTAPIFSPITGKSVFDPVSGLLVSVEVAAFHLSLANPRAGEWARRCGQGGYFCLPADWCRCEQEVSSSDYSLMLVGRTKRPGNRGRGEVPASSS